MLQKEYLHRFAAAIVKRSGIARPTVEAVLPHIFDEIRYQLTEGKLCVPIESFGTFAVVDIPERQRHYTYGGRDEMRTLPPKKKLKFAPTRNLRREINAGQFDPTRKSFYRHPNDPPVRARSNMAYNPRKTVYLTPIDGKASVNAKDTASNNS